MKVQLLITSLILFIGITSQAQSITRGSLTSAGGLFSAGGNTLTWTLAETVVGTFDGGTNGSLANGQQQIVISEQVSVKSVKEDLLNIRIYPNPTTSYVTLELEQTTDLEVQFINTDGKLLQRQKLTSNATKIDFSQVPSGIYWLNIQDEKENIKTYQIIKQ